MLENKAFGINVAHEFKKFNNKTYFSAKTQDFGSELWTIDAGQVKLVNDIIYGPDSGLELHDRVKFVSTSNDRLYFIASPVKYNANVYYLDKNNMVNGVEYDFKYDDCTVGYISKFKENSIIFAGKSNNGGITIYKLDDFDKIANRISNCDNCQYPFVVGDKVFYWSYSDNVLQLRMNAGSLVDDTLFSEFNATLVKPHWNNQNSFTTINGLTFFELQNPDGTNSLNVIDHEKQKIINLKSLNYPTEQISGLVVYFNGMHYFVASDRINGCELWKYDRILEKAEIVSDICPGILSSNPGISGDTALPSGGFYVFDNKLFFGANFYHHLFSNYILYVTDGTPSGTRPLVDPLVNPGMTPIWPAAYFSIDDSLYFSAVDSNNQRQIWRYTKNGDLIIVTNHNSGDVCQPIWTIFAE